MAATRREVVRVTGLVQGVGYRPFVHRLATRLGLAGWVCNDDVGVLVEVEGAASDLDRFATALRSAAPPLAVVDRVDRTTAGPLGGSGFRIHASRRVGGGSATPVPPDAAICDRCLAELVDPTDRRHRHPLISCTDCGPRFTVVEALPYDRGSTTLAAFPLCPACRAEYDDPLDRRHHAQTLSCPDCGPRCWYRRSDGTRREGDGTSVAAAVADLHAGLVVAVKGVGGYHLAVRADDGTAVQRLRDRKHRPHKPFAVLVRDPAWAERVAHLDGVALAAARGADRPVVLVRRRAGTEHLVAPAVGPGSALVGLLLAPTGLHQLLVADGPPVLVLTSANVAGRPIVHRDRDAEQALLGPLADSLLGHERPIAAPCDDSVVRVADGEVVPIRCSRGRAPLPVALPVDVPPTLAVGGELKAACCVADGRTARLGQHLGDVADLATLDALGTSADRLARLHGVTPSVTVADAHPGSLSRRWAERRDPGTVVVQHHRAHLAALLAEHGVPAGTEVAGVVLDGGGAGDDGTVWGGELFRGSYARLERVGHLATVPLPGGDAGVRHPARVAVAHLLAAGVDLDPRLPPVGAVGADLPLLVRQVERGVRCVPAGSMGRLFDAVASLVDRCHEATFEAQAPTALEALAAAWSGPRPTYRFEVGEDGLADGAPVVRAVAADVLAGVPPGAVAAAVHDAVVALVLAWAALADRQVVGLTGGVFQNALLAGAARRALAGRGFEVLTHRRVPPNDGGLALGQVVLAAARGG